LTELNETHGSGHMRPCSGPMRVVVNELSKTTSFNGMLHTLEQSAPGLWHRWIQLDSPSHFN